MTQKVAALKIALLVGCVAVIGLFIRLYFFVEPLWIDELHTAWAVSGEFQDVASRASIGNQSPLYFWILYTNCSFLNLSESSLRFPSLVFGVGCIALGYITTFRLTKDFIASIFAALVLACDSWFIFWSTEARPYAMLQFFALLQFMFLTSELENKTQNSKSVSISLVFSTILLPLIHLSAFFWLAWQFVFCLFSLKQKNVQRVIFSILLASVISLTLASNVEQVLSKRTDWNYFGDTFKLVTETQSLWLMLLASVAAFVYSILFKNKTRQPSNTTLKLLVATAIGPVFSAFLTSQLDLLPIAAPRYLAPSLILVPILCSVLLRNSGCWKVWFVVCFLIGIGFNPIIQNAALNHNSLRFRNENWKSAIEQMKALEAPENVDCPVFLFANLFEDHRLTDESPSSFIEYLKFPLNGIYVLDYPHKIIPMPTLVDSRWNNQHIDEIKNANSAQIVARVSRHDMTLIVEELERLAQMNQLSIQSRIFHQAGNDVRIAIITCLE